LDPILQWKSLTWAQYPTLKSIPQPWTRSFCSLPHHIATTHKHNRVECNNKRRFSCQPQSTTSAYQYIFRTSGNASAVYTWIICQVHLHAALEKTGAMTSTHLHKCQSSIHAPDFRIVLSLWKKSRPKAWHFELLRCACVSHSWGI